MPQKVPTLTKISQLAMEAANHRDMKVVMQQEYFQLDDPDNKIPKEERVKGYKYGKSIVAFTKLDEEALLYKSDDHSLKLLGFCSAKRVPRWHCMEKIELVVPDPKDSLAAPALAALIRAMSETDTVAIVRFCKRGNPMVAAMFPVLKANYSCFYLSKLPFAEDTRQYPFAPLAPARARKIYVPNAAQIKACDDLIDSLDLMHAARDDEGNPHEALLPKNTFNPVLQRFYHVVPLRAVQPETPLPKQFPQVDRFMQPPTAIWEKAGPPLKKFKDAFPLVKSDKAEEKSKKVFWKESLLQQKPVQLDSYVPDNSKKRKRDEDFQNISLDDIVKTGKTHVESATPVQDFNEMISRRDIDLVDRAIEEMEKVIVSLIEVSIKDSFYGKAMECLNALRTGCLREEEANKFNSFLRKLKAAYMGKKKDDFWRMIVEHNLTLISAEETDDSKVSEEEAAQFLQAQKKVATQSIVETPSKSSNKDEESADQLLAMVE